MINSLFPSVAWRTLATVASFLSSPAVRRLRVGEETAGAGREAERRYEPLHGNSNASSLPHQDHPLLIAGFIF